MAYLDISLKTKEVAGFLGITQQGLYKFLRDNKLNTYQPDTKQHKIYPETMREIARIRGFKVPQQKRFSVQSSKGGIGKTLLVHALSSRASMYGLKVLAVDLDHQANLTSSFNIVCRPKLEPTLVEVFQGSFNNKKFSIEEAIVQLTSFLHILPGNMLLSKLDAQIMASNENIGRFFSKLFAPVSDKYDLIIFDCPPALTRLVSCAHAYATDSIIPVNADKFSVDGMDLTIEHCHELSVNFGCDPNIHIVINFFDAREKLGLGVLKHLTERFPENLCDSYIGVSKELDNAFAANKCIWNHKTNPALEDLNKLTLELIDLENWKFKEHQQSPSSYVLEARTALPTEEFVNV